MSSLIISDGVALAYMAVAVERLRRVFLEDATGLEARA